MNIVETLKSQLSGNLNGISDALDTDPDSARTAVNAAIPSLLGGMASMAQTEDGARKLNSAVEQADTGMLGKLGGMLSGGGGASLAENGQSALGSLFGSGMLSSLGGVLSKFTGMGSGGIMKLLGMLAPAILGFFKGKKQEMGLDAHGLAGMLQGQKQNIASALPSGLSGMLGNVPGLSSISGMASGAVDGAARAGRAAVGAASSGARSAARWAVPVAGLVLLAFVIWKLIPDRKPDVNPNPVPNTDNAIQAGQKVVAKQTAKATDTAKGFFNSAAETFTGIKDAATAEAAVPKITELTGKLDSVQSAVDALPESAKGGVMSMLKDSKSTLMGLIDKVMKIPGVSDKVKPAVDQLVAKLGSLAT